jgi:hypothetical protein
MNKKIKVLDNVGPNYVLDTALYENNSLRAFMILLGWRSPLRKYSEKYEASSLLISRSLA